MIVFSTDFQHVPCMTIFDILDTIRAESIVVNANGSVAFESVTPDGKTIRFFGTGVEFKNDNLIIYEEGRIWGLDALGRVMVCDVHTIGDLPSRDSIALFPMYTFSSKTSVEHVEELYEGSPNINNEILGAQDYLRIGGYNTQGNLHMRRLLCKRNKLNFVCTSVCVMSKQQFPLRFVH